MSIHALERFPSLKEMNPFRKRRISDKLAMTAIPHEVAPADAAVMSRIEEIRQLPPEMIDRRLSNLLSLTNDTRYNGDTQEIPVVLTEAIHDTAEELVESWGDADHGQLSIISLTDAYALTGDEHLIQKAIEVVHNEPDFAKLWPNIDKVVEHSAETGDDFYTSFEQVAGTHYDVPMQVRDSEDGITRRQETTSDYAEQIPMEQYEYLFDPTIRRPNTPEYTHDGIHPSLKK